MTLSYRKVNSESVKQNNLFAKHINTILDEEQIKLWAWKHVLTLNFMPQRQQKERFIIHEIKTIT